MKRVYAHQVLDAAKRGAPISEPLITAALQATGDLSPDPIELELVGVSATERWADEDPATVPAANGQVEVSA